MIKRYLQYITLVTSLTLAPISLNAQSPTNQTPITLTNRISMPAQELIKLSHAKVSPEIINAYIIKSRISYDLSSDDILALKSNNVPDQVILSALKRGKEQIIWREHLLSRLNNNRLEGLIPLNIDSREYFEYYYLYPRTLQSVNQRLHPPRWQNPGFPRY